MNIRGKTFTAGTLNTLSTGHTFHQKIQGGAPCFLLGQMLLIKERKQATETAGDLNGQSNGRVADHNTRKKDPT